MQVKSLYGRETYRIKFHGSGKTKLGKGNVFIFECQGKQ